MRGPEGQSSRNKLSGRFFVFFPVQGTMQHMKEFKVNLESELLAIAKEVILMLEEVTKRENAAGVLALHGNLGAGKTTFMQMLAKELGVTEVVTSPTFVVMKKYEAEHEVFEHLVHIDAYRIEDVDEMRPLRFEEELSRKGTMIGIEWAEKIEALLPSYTIHLRFEITGETRVITIDHGN
ncbi:MAG: tRNA threonylcarbamoyladenosine biosynthesis protein TsaE [Candidatus Azotimanducaceae bacterium]